MMHHLIYLARLIVVALLVFAIVWYAQRNGSPAHQRGIAFCLGSYCSNNSRCVVISRLCYNSTTVARRTGGISKYVCVAQAPPVLPQKGGVLCCLDFARARYPLSLLSGIYQVSIRHLSYKFTHVRAILDT
jgi:hypothetical protein